MIGTADNGRVADWYQPPFANDMATVGSKGTRSLRNLSRLFENIQPLRLAYADQSGVLTDRTIRPRPVMNYAGRDTLVG